MSQMRSSQLFRIAPYLLLLVILLALLVLLMYRVLPTSVGRSDWIGYWTAARLLLHGEDPYDAENILRVQRQACPERERPMYAWNPPWLGVLILPLGALPFAQARVVWLLCNLFLITASSLAIWWLFDGSEHTSRLWLALPITFLFAHTLTALDVGQVTALILVGVTGFLVAFKLKRWILAGSLLALTTIKPHLVMLWLPLVCLWTLEKRRWQVWLGFGLTLTIWLIILTIFLPSWPHAYSSVLEAPPINWATPTVGGLLAHSVGVEWGRYIGLALLPAAGLLWWKTRDRRQELVTAALLPVGLTLAVFGWSYDQILLLLPITAIAVSLVRRELGSRDTWITAAMLSALAVVLFGQRIWGTNEVHYFWVPWAVLLMGLWVLWRRSRAGSLHDSTKTMH